MGWERLGRGVFRSALAGLLLVSFACTRPHAVAPEHPLNLLFVSLDTVRADHLGAYGAGAAETPALDALARAGVLFEHAQSAVPLTLPAHATMMSGLLPPLHGVHNNGAEQFPASLDTLATVLQAAGYRTGAFIGGFVLDHRFGLARGFDTYDDEIPRAAAGADIEAERSGAEVTDRALRWLQRADSRPFFLWVHLYDAHAPYNPPEPWRGRHASSLYDGEIAFVDSQVGRLLEALDRSGARAQTVVAVAGDHGEALGEHGERTHGLLLYEPTLRVPLIVRSARLPAGRKVREPVGLVDVAPTLAGLLGRRFAGPTDGRDLSAALLAGREPPPYDLYAETEYPRYFGWSPLFALRRAERKYIAAPRAELYDLGADPGEATNLVAGGGAPTEELAGRLTELRSAKALAPTLAADDAESRARLASLGYVGGAGQGATESDGLPDPKEQIGLFRDLEDARDLIARGAPRRARAILERLAAADPRNPIFRGTLAKALRDLGDGEAAIRHYRAAAESGGGDPEAWYNLGVALQEAGRRDEARQALRTAVTLRPQYSEARNVLGLCALLQGDQQDAVDEFHRAVVDDPRNASAWNNLGNALRDAKRYDEADGAYGKAIAAAPGYADPLNGMGVLSVQRGRPADAPAWFDRALVLAPRLHEARLNRAIAFEMAGARGPAIAAYRDFLAASAGDSAFEPQRRAARQMLARLSGETGS